MRFLSKIVFINSGAVRFAEINLDGNVHFIGTQGVGKSTILRAILFFYNADTQKLGISKEKKLFSEYYFPFANSYIVYEVTKETGSFCVLLLKSLGRISYRFIDGAFNVRNFVAEDGRVAETWDKIRAAFDQQGTDYSRKIDTYEEYRDIIYGNNEGKRDLRKYALLESRQYQSMARTIQNVFLNARLEAEFIKQTIIHSLSDVNVEINLQIYQYELKGFEEQLADIRQFRQSITQANNISVQHGTILTLDKEKSDYCRSLGRAVELAWARKPNLESALEQATGKKSRISDKVSELEKRFESKKKGIQDEIAILKRNLKIANEKIEHYAQINIEDMVNRVSRKSDHESKKANLEQEKGVLTTLFREITIKFGALDKELVNQLASFENGIGRRRNKIESDFLATREHLHQQCNTLVIQMEKQQQAGLREANDAHRRQAGIVQKLKEEKVGLINRRLYEEETDQAKDLSASLLASRTKIESNLMVLKGEAETRQKQWENDQKSRTESYERQKEKLDEKITRLAAKLSGIEATLRTGKDSLYGWLCERVPGWETSIGKVCDEKILFHTGLSPKINPDSQSSFYGVDVDLKEIERTVKTIADYEKERDGITAEIESLRRSISEISEQFTTDIEKLNKRHNAKLKENQDQQRLDGYRLQQTADKLKSAELALIELRKKADDEKQAALELIDSKLTLAADAELKANTAFEDLREDINKQRTSIERNRDRKIETTLDEKNSALEQLGRELDEYIEGHQERRKALEKQRHAELSGQGADTDRLSQIEEALKVLGNELEYIEQNLRNVHDYERDKIEFINRIDEFKQQHRLHEQQLEQEEIKFQRQKDLLDEKIKVVDAEIHAYQDALDKLNEDLEAFHNFQNWPWFEKVSHFLKEPSTAATIERCKDLVQRIQESHYLIVERLKELREMTHKYLGRFSAANIFQFNTNLSTEEEYLQFADELSRFIVDDKISEYEKRVNERYANIINLIAKETTGLASREGEIQGVIGKINRDITEKNFVGVIKKIELKMDESANRVVQILKMITRFHDENGLVLGAADIFSWQHDNDATNKKAVDLLKQLIKEVGDYKHDVISLSDSFELKFRVIENQNDTGWVERLSNVGSEGTDILVKAMLNIMLLNVFKEGASRKFKDFKLHCVMDEIGRLHPANVRGILKFANDRNILLINGSPTETDALAYRHIYKLEKDAESITKVKRIITQHGSA